MTDDRSSDDTPFDRGVDVEKLADEISALRAAADAYATAKQTGSEEVAQLGNDLERVAIRYANRRSELIEAASRVDYLAIVRAAARDRERSDN